MRITKVQIPRNFEMHRLEGTEHIKEFDCGDEDLNDFILNESQNYSKAMISVTYIIVDKSRVIAYFSLANDKLSVSDFNSNSEFNRFRKHRFPYEKMLRSYPAVKLCRLAIDISAKGLGIGTILVSFIKVLYKQNNRAGCRFVTVDAYNTAAPFYEKNGFQLLTKKENKGNTVPLYYDLTAI